MTCTNLFIFFIYAENIGLKFYLYSENKDWNRILYALSLTSSDNDIICIWHSVVFVWNKTVSCDRRYKDL